MHARTFSFSTVILTAAKLPPVRCPNSNTGECTATELVLTREVHEPVFVSNRFSFRNVVAPRDISAQNLGETRTWAGI